MKSSWRRVSLGDITLKITKGTTPTTIGGRFVPEGVCFVKVESITADGRLEHEKIAHIDEATHMLLARSKLEADDVLFTIAGSIGRVARVPADILPANTNQAVAIVRPNRELVDPRYLYYALRNPAVVTQAHSRVVQSVQANFSLGELASIPLVLPPLDEQMRIADCLGHLDDMIASNRRISNMIPALIHHLIEKAAEAESVDVPIAQLARFVNGGAFTKGASGTGRMVLRIAELNSGPGPSTVYNGIDVPEDKLARRGDILMSWSGSLGVYRWFRDEAIVNQHIFKVIPSGYPAWLVFDRLEEVIDVFRGIAKDKATTMGHIQRGHLESTTVRIPSDAEVRSLDETMDLLWQRLLLADREILSLAGLRDTLLLKLMSEPQAERVERDVVEVPA
jgi:type I restriction enzyme S subunit